MTRRAEQVDETRLRITEAAVRLHTTVGPSNTSIASVAEEAGVTRLTVYRHFASLDDLFLACTAHWRAQHPAPDPSSWRGAGELEARARRGFGELYAWFRENVADLFPIYRDTQSMPPAARRAAEARTVSLAGAILDAEAADAKPAAATRRQEATARHFVEFRSWYSLAVDHGLPAGEDVEVAVRALLAAGTPSRPSTGRRRGTPPD
jgi:AcrR family transcriptional regulator